MATSRTNCNVALLFCLLYKVKQVMGEYFKEVEEESIRYVAEKLANQRP